MAIAKFFTSFIATAVEVVILSAAVVSRRMYVACHLSRPTVIKVKQSVMFKVLW